MLRDYLNVPTREELYTFVLAEGQAIAVLGVNQVGDIPQETWYFDENSMAIDNGLNIIRPNDILETDPGRYLLNMVQADWNMMFNKPDLAVVATSGSYEDLLDKITAGNGITMTGNEVSVDDTKFMSIPTADAAIATMQADINTKTPESRTITLNGQTKDLSGNRSWEVGDISSTGSYSNPSWITSLAFSKLSGTPTLFSGAYADLTGKPSLFSGSYTDLTNKPTIPAAQVNSDWNAVSGVAQILNKPTIPTNTNQLTNGAGYLTGVTSSQITTALGLTPVDQAGARSAISLTTTGTSGAATYSSSTGVLNIPNYTSASRTFNNNVSRTLNSNFTISTTKDASVNYSVALSVTNPLLAGTSSASAFLEYSVDGGTNWITVSQVANSSSVVLTVTVAITLPNTFILSGNIPANALVRIRTVNAGTASATFVRAQEMLY